MTHDFLEEFTQALEKEGKLFVIAIFPKDMSHGFTSQNLDEAPNQTQTFPNGATYSVRQSAVMAIQHSLDLPQGSPTTVNQTYPVYQVRLSGSSDCMHGYLMEFAAWGEVDAEAKAGRLTEKDKSGYGRPVGPVKLNKDIRAKRIDYIKFSP